MEETFIETTDCPESPCTTGIEKCSWNYPCASTEVRSLAGAKIFLLAAASRPALGPTQPPVQWVPGVLSPGVRRDRGVLLTTHPHLVPRSRMSKSYTSSPPQAPPWSVAGQLHFIAVCNWRYYMAIRIPNLGSRWMGEVSLTLPPGKEHAVPRSQDAGWGPTDLDIATKRWSLFLPEIEPRSSNPQPVTVLKDSVGIS
jgi:hypothetical protein